MNPWASDWSTAFGQHLNPFRFQGGLDAFNPWAGTVRDFWIAEAQRHQQALMAESASQSWQSWMNAWTVLPLRMFGQTGTRI